MGLNIYADKVTPLTCVKCSSVEIDKHSSDLPIAWTLDLTQIVVLFRHFTVADSSHAGPLYPNTRLAATPQATAMALETAQLKIDNLCSWIKRSIAATILGVVRGRQRALCIPHVFAET